jgi:GNAT superfamily N-acetyltransferase
MTEFELEFETRIRQLKSEFLAWRRAESFATSNASDGLAAARARTLHQRHESHIADLRALVKANFDHFDARHLSSLLALPSKSLDAEEKILHRIWMGGAPSSAARGAMAQWNHALIQVDDRMTAYRQLLWVWDEPQMRSDPHFEKNTCIAHGGIGRYTVGAVALEVYSLRSLAQEFLNSLFPLLDALQEYRYFVNLSDLFRLLILREFGGIYLDIDTLPSRSAPIFLAKPEVPDFMEPGGGHVSWLNLYRDENGVLAATRGNIAVRDMVMHIVRNLAALSHPSVRMRADCADARVYAAMLQRAIYEVWAGQIGYSFQAYGDIAQRFCVLHDAKREPVIGGLEGMRLIADAIDQTPLPLSPSEQRSFDHCIAELESRNWSLQDALQLEKIGEVFYLHEPTRMAYPPQLRSRMPNCAYYSFLSHDERLDRVNALFGAYLIEKNYQLISEDGFWRATCGASASQAYAVVVAGGDEMLTFVFGSALADEYKDRMAKLLFGTSYLEYCSFGNKLNVSFVELQRRQNIDPYLSLVRGMQNGDGDFVGFFIAGTSEEFAEVQSVSYYRDDMRAMDEAYEAFVARHARPGDLFVSSLAIDEPWRGKGLFNTMFREIELLARSKGCHRIVLTVWENKSSAMQIYLKKGFRAEGRFEFASNLFFDHLHFLSYELESVLTYEEQY